ncbi:MAG: N-acetyl-gamma-glutamyl-phosphate reductase [Kiritimatiellae bacterium]|nr:N-acetyl-gamma-glutamyl-phosphate reductase [Kiritimatiellia bacterium]
MMKKVFIDGSAGTTGLRIRERLAARADLEVVTLAEAVRKDPEARRAALNAADVAFLCLPDAAAVEAVSLVDDPDVVVIDTSTAHRTLPDWTYGFPEIGNRRARVAAAKRIANPGCHASGFIACVAPLVEAGLVSANAELCAFSLTGYSGGGKKMIAQYEAQGGEPLFLGGRQYALGQAHKHLPEMAKTCGLSKPPVFSPVVVPHLSGMEVTVLLHASQLRGDLTDVKDCYADYYRDNGVVRFEEEFSEDGFLSSAALSGRDDMEVSAWGNAERIALVARYDNLGKGASGAAIQNMNVVLGADETEGLVLDER